MKKIIVAVVVIGVLAMTVLAYGYTTDLFKAVKLSNFQLGMSQKRAKSVLSSYELTGVTESTTELGESTILTFENGELEETLLLFFTNDRLSGFNYLNWQIR